MTDLTAFDADIRLHVYTRLLEDGRAPTVAGTADAFGRSTEEVEAAYRRLAEGRAIVLHPGTVDVWMAPPLSAVRTPFLIEAQGRERFGNCVWDGLGVLAMVRADGVVRTSCADCDEPLDLVVRDGRLEPSDSVIHFAVPAARWWEDIGFA